MKCKETAGLLFPRACEQLAAGQCADCGRPVCDEHLRKGPERAQCVSCVRTSLRDQQHRGSYAHLRDDPYFFWYFGSGRGDDAFTASDYALFGDAGGGDFDASFERDWSGS